MDIKTKTNLKFYNVYDSVFVRYQTHKRKMISTLF